MISPDRVITPTTVQALVSMTFVPAKTFFPTKRWVDYFIVDRNEKIVNRPVRTGRSGEGQGS
ncbi:MAG: hypothetical protein FD153_1221 [Rhodospirillaceae bacterium]|nr:MAG: hypothetical protein FD153_1221 [Rhodospirillaceae bacterium]